MSMEWKIFYMKVAGLIVLLLIALSAWLEIRRGRRERSEKEKKKNLDL